MPAPWQDALARARAGGRPPTAVAAAPTAVAAAPAPVAAIAAPAVDPASVAPGLARLLEERAALERSMAALTGAAPSDPRYAVAPLAERRAELARWGGARDAARAEAAREAPRTPGMAFPEPLLRGTPGESVRATPGESVRETPGALPRVPALPDLARGRAEAGRRISALRDVGSALSDAGRALRAPGERREGGGDPLDRRLAAARDMAARGRRSYAAAERALGAARSAIPDGWEERARERIPGLGRADPYVREAARKLAVVVGTIDEMTAKAEQLRESASAARELREADAANDDARRDRALERLRARRAEGGGDA
ncbi:hypothetical protein [Sandaracinobacteroides saxicola]|uniref:Uncharacterized protein n=1 Tax=Sandaracinobacteroides saxicola TaxID=2759707 RepID=A0A7G5IHL2_9SPHN|nr:hypothetical protein [Sandaracinobacteroides saxicola]QMW22854.1 hypothetical protein H3309_16415 [Sandaracinobacteroides saxicola]